MRSTERSFHRNIMTMSKGLLEGGLRVQSRTAVYSSSTGSPLICKNPHVRRTYAC